MLDKDKHLLVLKQLLREIYSDNELSAQLVFKGGTALMLFHELERFSTDLVFDLRDTVSSIDFDRLRSIAERYLAIKNAAAKQNTYLVEGSHETGMQQIKIEVSRRSYPQVFHCTIFLASAFQFSRKNTCLLTSFARLLRGAPFKTVTSTTQIS